MKHNWGGLLRRKRLLLCIVLSVLLCAPFVVSVEAASMWNMWYGGAEYDVARSVVVTSDGGYAIAASISSWVKAVFSAFLLYGVGFAFFWNANFCQFLNFFGKCLRLF